MVSQNPFAVTRRYSPPSDFDLPHPLADKLRSYEWLLNEGLEEVLRSVSPIADENAVYRYSLRLSDAIVDEPKYSPDDCRALKKTYAGMLRCKAVLHLLPQLSGEETIKEGRRIALAPLPLMTDNGSFVINGTERVVINQIVRSPGIVFMKEKDEKTGADLAAARIIPRFGVWVRLMFDADGVVWAVIDQKTRIPVTTLFFALGATRQEMEGRLGAVEHGLDILGETLAVDKAGSHDEAIEIWFQAAFAGERAPYEYKEERIERMLQNPLTYDLGAPGRHRLNISLDKSEDADNMLLTRDDLYRAFCRLIQVHTGEVAADDQDHMRYRRIRTPGELIQNSVRIGLKQLDYVIRTNKGAGINEQTNPRALLTSPLVGRAVNAFMTSGLTQLLDQTNPLSEIAHKRRITALGPGGVSRDRAGLDMRDVHRTHYGRICPVETPEGANCGIVNTLANYARIDEHGFLETPYRKVLHSMHSGDPDLLGRIVLEDVYDLGGERRILVAGSRVDLRRIKRLAALDRVIAVQAYVSDGVVEYLSPDDEEGNIIGQANTDIDELGQIVSQEVEYRKWIETDVDMDVCAPRELDYLDVSALQLIGNSAALIPFLEHDDITRALMGANMQRQAVPCETPELPFVGTGIEAHIANGSGYSRKSPINGEVQSVTSDRILVETESGDIRSFRMARQRKQNGGLGFNQRPAPGIEKKAKVVVGQPIIDGPSTYGGELALGHNLLVAFMCWDGYNYEDSLLVSEAVVRQNKFMSVHVETHRIFVCSRRSGGDGAEIVTRNLPDLPPGAEEIVGLDENGFPRVGAWLDDGDVILGITQRRLNYMMSDHEKLLRAIKGGQEGQEDRTTREWRDLSKRMAHGHKGRVIDVQVITNENDDDSEMVGNPDATMLVKVTIARRKCLMEGDKMAGRHGNKGIVSRVLRQEDMPYLEDGTPVDICVTPIGVPSRMNLGQILEVHLGMAAAKVGFRAICPSFGSASALQVEDALAQAWFIEESGACKSMLTDREKVIDLRVLRNWLAVQGYSYSDIYEGPDGSASDACIEVWLREKRGCDTSQMSVQERRDYALSLDRLEHICAPVFGKQVLYDGRTGEKYDRPVTVGIMYMIKLNHLVEHKVHARSTGPYAMMTAQPVGGKAKFGGQRMGEMEVWALEAYSAANLLREMSTVKSDDIEGRNLMYNAVLEGGGVPPSLSVAGKPQAYLLLEKELQSVGMGLSEVWKQDNGNQFIQPAAPAVICPMHLHDDDCADNKGLRSIKGTLGEQGEDAIAQSLGDGVYESLIEEMTEVVGE